MQRVLHATRIACNATRKRGYRPAYQRAHTVPAPMAMAPRFTAPLAVRLPPPCTEPQPPLPLGETRENIKRSRKTGGVTNAGYGIILITKRDDRARIAWRMGHGSPRGTDPQLAHARNNVVMSAGKRSCPDMICYLLSVITVVGG